MGRIALEADERWTFIAEDDGARYNSALTAFAPDWHSVDVAGWFEVTPDRHDACQAVTTDGLSRITDPWREEALGRPDGHTQLEAAPMASQADVRRIALSLPETEEARNHFAFSVRNKGKLKGFVWVWMERLTPKKPRVPQPDVIAVRVANLDDKDSLLALNPAKFFTEPHYNGFPAVLVNLPSVTVGELKPLITEAWRCQAPKDLDLKKKPRVKRESS